MYRMAGWICRSCQLEEKACRKTKPKQGLCRSSNRASPTALRGETPFGCQAVTIRAEAISPADGKLDLQ